MPRCDCTRPALFKIHISLPAFATEIPSNCAICARVSDSPCESARASWSKQRNPYSSCADIFIKLNPDGRTHCQTPQLHQLRGVYRILTFKSTLEGAHGSGSESLANERIKG